MIYTIKIDSSYPLKFHVATDKNELFCILNSELEWDHGVQLHHSFVIVRLMFILALAMVS